ncbi:MAG TPA: DUF3017 domain-containing protein [Nocardioides sp.]|nr:DUF3017 domain-containing protein [Nocardioides sp.]
MSEPEPPAESIEPPEEPIEPVERRYPSTIGGAFYIGILIATAIGIGIVYESHDWRLGVRVVAGALFAAALLRLVLPQKDAGMLAVRHRLIDVGLLVAVGGALFILAGTIPDQPL